jgi:hypothetical protein
MTILKFEEKRRSLEAGTRVFVQVPQNNEFSIASGDRTIRVEKLKLGTGARLDGLN